MFRNALIGKWSNQTYRAKMLTVVLRDTRKVETTQTIMPAPYPIGATVTLRVRISSRQQIQVRTATPNLELTKSRSFRMHSSLLLLRRMNLFGLPLDEASSDTSSGFMALLIPKNNEK